MATTTNFKLLSVYMRESEPSPIRLRFSVDNKFIKYVLAEHGTYPADRYTDPDEVAVDFPPFPIGPWNAGRLSKDSNSGKSLFSSLETLPLGEVTTVWHPTKIDYFDLITAGGEEEWWDRESQRLVTHPSFDKPVVMKISDFPIDMHMSETETRAYKMLQGTGIAPEFLGHVTEGSRVIGFLREHIPGAECPGVSDINICHEALERLYELGIIYHSDCLESFLIKDGKVHIVDFETAEF